MKVCVQIPCLNEAPTLHEVINCLPDKIDGIQTIETLIIDDGSTDGTAQTAMALGVDHIVRHKANRGLAMAFSSGLDACRRLGADIIVNIDGDNQYDGRDIPRLIEPILAGRADMVIGDRRPAQDFRAPWIKRQLQRLGSRVVGYLAGQPIPDPVSGFRAMTSDVALKTHIVTGFSYTIESVLQAANRGLAIEFVSIETRIVDRPSRLFRSIPEFVYQSGLTMLRVFFMFRPFAVLFWISCLLAVIGGIPIARFLIFFAAGDGVGHIQSLVLGGMLIVLSMVALVAGLLADLIACNRRLLEMTLEKVKHIECDAV